MTANVVVINRRAAHRTWATAGAAAPTLDSRWAPGAPAAHADHRRATARPSMWLVSHGTDVSAEDLELLALLASGLPAPQVARALAVSDRTIRRRVRTICDAVGVGTAIEAVAWAARQHLI